MGDADQTDQARGRFAKRAIGTLPAARPLFDSAGTRPSRHAHWRRPRLVLPEQAGALCHQNDSGTPMDWVTAMKDMQRQLEKLRVQVAECEIIRDLATNPKKKELFARLVEQHKTLVDQIERAMTESKE